MRIEKIELIGFKSFAEKTTFTLHPGITCIVGPNGSGKSNIVDSFRWVLGEQSAKSLRGEKMEEVIFNGSANKKARGLAEVNLMSVFDGQEQGNGDTGALTTISRRLYRSGESEYLINRAACRLKDIRDLFLDTGLEIRSYSILEQGKMSEILNAKPQDRRFLIEEVAGVMKYKVRRAEALSKLEGSRLNLQRINDIVTEVKRQINSLDRQVKKAERYKRLSSEAREIELKVAKREFTGLKESLEQISAEHLRMKEQETLLRADLNTAENTRETKRIALLEKEKALELRIGELQEVEREVADKERAIAVATAERTHLTESLLRMDQQHAAVEQRIAGGEARRAELGSTEEHLVGEIEVLRQELSERNESIRGIEEDLSEKEAQIEQKRREVFRIAEDLSRLRNEGSRLATTVENLERKRDADIREADSTKEQLGGIDAGIAETEAQILNKNSELMLLNERKAKTSREIEESRAKLDDVRSRLAKTREDLASASSRLDSLREIMFEDLSKDVLTEAEKLHVLTTISETIDVDEQHEKAIENVLAEKVNGFVLPSLDDVANAAVLLKDRSIGRTVFIPRSAVPTMPEDTLPIPLPARIDGVVGRAADLTKVQEDKRDFEPVVRSLLRDIVVVRDLACALALVGGEDRFTFVTLDGEIVEPSGAVTIGEGKGILKRKREVRELMTYVEGRQAEIATLGDAISANEAALQDRKDALRDLDAAFVSTEKEISLLRLTADTRRSDRERTSRKLAYLHMEQEEVHRERESLQRLIAEKENEIRAIETRKALAEQSIVAIQEEVSRTRSMHEAERASVTELRLSLNSLKERTESVRKELEQVGRTLEELVDARERLLAEAEETRLRMGQRDEDIGRDTETLKGLVVRADGLKEVISAEREVIRNEADEVNRIEHTVKGLRTTLDSITSRTAEVEVSLAEHRMKLENLTEGMRLNYSVEIETLEAEPVLEEDEGRLAELREKIQDLGPVNLGTLEEYQELQTRFDFLSKQQDDLNRSIAELEEAITKINSTTRKKLRDAFEQLNGKFSEVFVHLFGGGKAELVLTDDSNILETGIDIIAQPPGKKLQNINLLSGGEKALTALSLLFASFLIKPSPLCILDEVDAPLDDANVGRFGRMLRDLAGRIQFIVVTHNRITMEAADYIYGITMEEPGVSKVISMQLADSPVA